ncbi:hypothetical protein IT570_06980 [Candidatus Sumerlaeota bacterium]|nr:hypothetical protein [Candidatus Sumerlaeota bacterium]
MKIEGFDWFFRLYKIRLIAGFVGLLCMMVVVVVVAGDFIKATPVTESGIIVSKEHREGHYTSKGKYRNEKWSVKVKGDKVSGSCTVTKTQYDSLNNGETVEVNALKGGLIGLTLVRSVKKPPAASPSLDGPPPDAK